MPILPVIAIVAVGAKVAELVYRRVTPGRRVTGQPEFLRPPTPEASRVSRPTS
ncbi:hypothetical protein GA0074692_1327 [Micromonospora pallida]|uniref:Uncharacterized protein n=1 Tax=Micromonospora pallida TaxID=145854 RepID=A0A1C6RY32_9ACTN|nr:hypothetical protein [Micromonospora pallida]SCL22097.1 hypothetical protein GA0074692_1327 [Micromonospora pallida]